MCLSPDTSPIAVLRHELEQLRRYLDAMAERLVELERETPPAARECLLAARPSPLSHVPATAHGDGSK